MTRRKFKLSHSVVGLILLLALQGLLLYMWPVGAAAWLLLCFAAVGAIVTLYVATEVVEEVRSPSHMVVLLSVVVAEFVLFFACEYWYLGLVSPASFPTLPPDITSLLLHSMMVFVFNPLYLPSDTLGRVLLLINTASSMGLALFILQNISQFRRAEK